MTTGKENTAGIHVKGERATGAQAQAGAGGAGGSQSDSPGGADPRAGGTGRGDGGLHVAEADRGPVRPGSDEELMTQVRDGEAAQLAPLFDRYHVSLFNFYLRMGADRAASEDLVQETFLRALKYRHTWRHGVSFRGWLFQIARNARLDYLRKRRGESAWDEAAEASQAQPPRDLLAEREQRFMLRQALVRLPEEKREVLVLSRFHDLRYEEIGRMLGCETGAVKVRVHRALKELREVFLQLTGRMGREGAGQL